MPVAGAAYDNRVRASRVALRRPGAARHRAYATASLGGSFPSSASIAAASASLSWKPSCRLAAMCAGWLLRGTTAWPPFTAHRSTTCLGVTPCRSAAAATGAAVSTGFERKPCPHLRRAPPRARLGNPPAPACAAPSPPPLLLGNDQRRAGAAMRSARHCVPRLL